MRHRHHRRPEEHLHRVEARVIERQPERQPNPDDTVEFASLGRLIGGTVIVNTRKPLDLKSGLIAGAVSMLGVYAVVLVVAHS